MALAVQKYIKTVSGLADCVEENIPKRLSVFSFPEKLVPACGPLADRLQTTNGLNQLDREIRHSTRVAVLFPITASRLRLTASFMEISEEWQTHRTYIRLDGDDYC